MGEGGDVSKNDLSIDQALTMLAEAPAQIATLTDGLSPASLRRRPSPDEWSVTDVLAHLRSCADMWGDGITRILDADHPTFRAINPRTWMERTDYPDLEFRPSFDAFTAQRADLMSVLRALSPEEWARSGTVTGAGKPIERTVESFAVRLAIHERPHIKQIKRIASQIRSAC